MGDVFPYLFFFGIALFLFPVFLFADVYLDAAQNRCWFAISLYKHLKLFGGYVQVCKQGFVFHLTEKKAVLLAYKDLAATRKKFEVTKGFQLYRFHQIVEISGATKIYGTVLAAVIQAASFQTFAVLQTKHPFLSLKNSTLLCEEPCLKLTFQTVLVFNLLILAIAVAKKILEAIINWIRKKRSTASWKKQPSN